jgi:uncharacterized membrane protein YbhN (UPF0104 family)
MIKSLTRSRTKLLLLTFLLTVALLAVVIPFVDFDQLMVVLLSIDLSWYLMGMLATCIYHYWRGLRVAMMAEVELSVLAVYPTMCIQAFIRNILPAWFGELGLIWLLKHFHSVNLVSGATIIFLTRLIDLLVVSFVLAFGLLTWRDGVSDNYHLAIIILLSFLSSGAFIYFFFVRIGPSVNQSFIFKRIVIRCPAIVQNLFIGVAEEISRLHSFSDFLKLLLISVLMWSSMLFVFMFYLLALSADVNLAEVMIIFSVVVPMNMLPIRGVANIGTHELVWIAALVLVGIPVADSSLLAIGTHAMMLLTAFSLLFLGLLGRLFLREPSET